MARAKEPGPRRERQATRPPQVGPAAERQPAAPARPQTPEEAREATLAPVTAETRLPDSADLRKPERARAVIAAVDRVLPQLRSKVRSLGASEPAGEAYAKAQDDLKQHLELRAAAVKALRKFEGQRGSLSFRKQRPVRDVEPVDTSVKDKRLNETLDYRKPTPNWREEANKTWRENWRDLKNKVGYMEDIKDFPQVRNDIRLAEQDKFDAYEEGSKRIAHIMEPVIRSPSQRRAVGKIVMLEDMLDRSKRPRGTPEEIADAVEELSKARDAMEAAAAADKRAAGRRVANASRALKMKLKPLDNPLGFTPAELQSAHDELYSRATPGMIEALKRHRDDAWRMLEDGVKRGYFDESLLTRKGETYFPHYVITQGDALKDFIPGLPAALREPFRGWTERAVGSRKLIDFDYENAWRKHVIRTELANKIDDFMARNLPRLDRMPEEGSPEYIKLFRQTDGKVPKPSELPYYTGGGGPTTTFDYKGEPHVVYRYQPFRWRTIPKSKLMGMLQDSTLKPFNDPHLIPLRTAKYLEVARNPDQYMWEKAWSRYVTGWKATQIVAGGLSTRAVNTFGDFYQLYLEDFPAFLMTLPRMPKVMRAMFGNPTDPMLKEFQGLLKTHRITEGSTFFGPEAYKLRQAWREAPPDQRMAMVLKHGFDMPGYVANAMEVWPRVTKAYADFLRIKSGKPLKSKVYSIEGLSPYEQMGVLARNTFVDYAAVSDFHRKWLRTAYFPFLTWFQRTFNYTLGYAAQNPVNAAMKIATPAAAMWFWNNYMVPDLERDQPQWIKRFPLHITTNIPHPLNPETNTTIVFPTGNDMALEVLQVPAMMDRVGQWVRGDRTDPLTFKGWSSIAATMLNIGKTMGQRLVDLSPITQAIGSVWANHDARTGEPIVPPAYVGDQYWESYYKATYVAMKTIPVFDRIFQQMDKDAKRPGGLATTPYGRLWESLVSHGVFNPVYGPMQGFAFPIDPRVGFVNRMRSATQPYDVERREGGAGFMDSLAAQLGGKDPQAIRKWAQENPEALQMMSPQNFSSMLTSPGQLHDLFETLQGSARTPEEREKYRRLMLFADRWRRWQSLIESPKGPQLKAWIDEIKRRRGQPPSPPETAITGEGTAR